MNNMSRYIYILLLLILFSCEKWEKTDGISIVSHFPTFELTGGNFQSFVKGELEEWEDPGYKAFVEDREVEVRTRGNEVNTDSVGAYFRIYVASNAEQIQSSAIRTIAITHRDVSQTDLSGIYETAQFGQLVQMRVVKKDEKGYYECEDVLGFPGAEMPGEFADLGLGQLQLVPGDGDFGSYASTRGSHTPNTLTFEIEFEEEPNKGVIVTVTWFREDN
jgi:hypothetical protein